LAFTRQKGDEKLLFVFNLTREAVEFPVPKGMEVTDILPMPSFEPLFDAGIVKLEGLDVFCGVVA
ncbi:MAG: alpha-glucosidase C-terminal domain-containing protein, partial [Agrobacterium tumefaciens]